MVLTPLRFRILPVCAFTFPLLLAACGSEGDSPAVKTQGVVVGSYFRNAKVCIDSNGNGQCDNGEITTHSDAKGHFTLAGTGAVVAEVGTDAIEYDPIDGSTSKVSSTIVLRAPKEAPSVVSFYSTSVASEMEANKLSLQDAVNKVASSLGVSPGKVLSDFNQESDSGIRQALKAASDQGLMRIAAALSNSTEAERLATLTQACLAERYYQTKTPYQPQQDPSTYEAPPSGYNPIYVQMVARHGSRGLSSLKYDLAVYNMWKQAAADGALTPLGAKLGPDVLKLMKANFLLGYRVSGISSPGYGNETAIGIAEHRALAARMVQRQSAFWSSLTGSNRQIVVVTSGVDRAVDSGNYFITGLSEALPALSTLVTRPAAPAPYPDTGAAVAQPAGTNHFLLYFHKLSKNADLVTNASNPYYQTYRDSVAYQSYKASDADMQAKQAAIYATAEARAAGRTVLERLFTPAFVNKIEDGSYSFSNTGTFSYTSSDGQFTNTLTGDGKTSINSAALAGSLLYELYVIAPAMTSEAGVDLSVYMPLEQARFYAQANDTSDFYDKGPGITEKGDATYKMAQVLVDDMFSEVDAVQRGDLSHAAKLRFAHAETMIPFASLMGLKGVLQQTPLASTYNYDNNTWRGETVSRMAANMQWDVYRNSSGRLIVKMYYDERETDFKAACDSARLAGTRHFYDYIQLAACYGH